jgi:crotonobetainyl-CoA:carnitine CoA-transferase CaiB-like acyl-CoA transferase
MPYAISHTPHDAALAGRRVLELADATGVYCGKLLADMGADVIKIEPPGGDPTRHIPPFWGDTPEGDTPHPDQSLFFLYMNTSKRGVTLDITTSDGRAPFLRLAATADVVIETFAPGYLDSLGLGYGTLKAANPRLVLTSITDLTSRYTVDEIYHEGQRRHLAFTPVNTAAAADDPQLAARKYSVEVEHSGTSALRYPGAPYRHSETPWSITRAAPRVGEHNEEIYCGELGLTDGALRDLKQRGIV